ncbi:hypothetical protein HU200_040865 [Digitaria exilis]|uniref:NB-ARC domain-containing protein n=1 Tax=Digitaria exilis TaxID=1010633 RepID=A0A835BD40_9POAL|nr:hypothetical protein HU200_040865 [Digitaria exilis]
MNTLLPKLAELVVGEYKLQKGVKGEIKELEQEMECITAALHKKAKTNHKIHNVIKDIMDQVKKVSERRDRFRVDNIAARPTLEPVDPRLEGLGKTTLANSLLQDLKSKFDCHFFVSVSLNPDIKKIFKNILLQLDEKEYSHMDEAWEIKLLIDKIIDSCLCVIDDLWKELPWDTIKLALPDGNRGSKIIMTTRNKAVAEHVGGDIYELNPLSDDDSRELLYRRVFDSVDDCPAASLLASKQRCSVEWEKVNNAIGSGSQSSHHGEKMNTILRLSYNDLPFHLKTCLLSLSKYPEDQVIRKDVLVWSWIAEELGVYACQLHDMVLEVIIKLSAEEGFVTTSLSDGQQAGAPSLHHRDIIRRLSIHSSSNTNASINENKDLSKVRSLDVFGNAGLMPALSRFRVLRVLQVEDCTDLDKNHLKDLGLNITELPESIGKLESLETLDIRGCYKVIMLPVSFDKLGKLVRLLASTVLLPHGVVLENMKSLQELVGISPTRHAMALIGKLRGLKVLEFAIKRANGPRNCHWVQAPPTDIQVPSLVKELVIRIPELYPLRLLEQFPSSLQTFNCNVFLRAFPSWINMSLTCLTTLSISLMYVRIQLEHLDKLAVLPSLRFLRIRCVDVQLDAPENLVIHGSASAFSCLTDLRIVCEKMFLKFQPGAMRKLQRLCLNFNAELTNEHFRTNDFDYGFQNLPSLRHVNIHLMEYYPEAEDAIRKTVNDHPNHPLLKFQTRGQTF